MGLAAYLHSVLQILLGVASRRDRAPMRRESTWHGGGRRSIAGRLAIGIDATSISAQRVSARRSASTATDSAYAPSARTNYRTLKSPYGTAPERGIDVSNGIMNHK